MIELTEQTRTEAAGRCTPDLAPRVGTAEAKQLSDALG
jgi:hypothetical protein